MNKKTDTCVVKDLIIRSYSAAESRYDERLLLITSEDRL